MKRIVLGHSGGFETSLAIPWLAERFGAEVIAVTIDLGQKSELVEIRERALALGAVRCHVIDAREELIRDYVLPSLQAGALYDHRAPMTAALERPLVVKKLVDIAHMEGAERIAHGSIRDHDREGVETLARALAPSIEVIAPAHIWGMSRAEQIEYAKARSIPVPADEGAYVVDTNLWGRSIRSRTPSDLWVEPSGEVFALTRAAQECPAQPAFLEIDFEAGVPVRANGIEMSLLEMIESLETIAGAHGVGRIDVIDNRLAGTKSRDIYEAPAAVVLHAAHRELEELVIDRDLERLTHTLGVTYADLVYDGRWFSQTREAIGALVAAIQPRVTGSIRLKLFKGDCRVVGRQSPFALFDRELAAATAVSPTKDR